MNTTRMTKATVLSLMLALVLGFTQCKKNDNLLGLSAEEEPLTFEAMTAGSKVTFTTTTGADLQYSVNDGMWQTYKRTVTLSNVGDKVSFRGNNAYLTTSSMYSTFSCSGQCYVYGNVMSLLNSTDYANITTLSHEYVFRKLFKDNTAIYSHPTKAILLPATTVTRSCYDEMFYGCKNLTTAPELPATTVAPSCYTAMFESCESLTVAPDLPATTLCTCCYQSMFANCKGMTVAPELPAPVLVDHCYSYMFANCVKVNSLTCLATDFSATSCTYYWLSNVAPSGTFRTISMVGWTAGDSGIPFGWRIEEIGK